MAPKHSHEKKNKEKGKDEGGWCTDDLEFDREGCLYIKNEALAREIEMVRQAWGGLLNMCRDTFEEEKTENGGPIEGPKANMLCPCDPNP